MQAQTFSPAPQPAAAQALPPPGQPASSGTAASPVSAALLQRFDGGGPRYTSYPTADRFVEAFDEEDYAASLRQRRTIGAKNSAALSL
ncbi:MAG: hypothetical protein JSS56_26735, partial [Proteobacteria bacterium]|nr:hypothetical protein [Pseudomonadota bacterium]